jgi:SAM-dependent methyltransferase
MNATTKGTSMAAIDGARILELPDDQILNFDLDFISDGRFAAITACLDRDFPSGSFRFLDVGGGNGAFADRLLEHYPLSRGTVVDNAKVLIDRNAPNPRKTLAHMSVEDMAAALGPDRFDVVFFNFSLHHFVVPSYRRTRELQRRALIASRPLLTEGGRVSVVENLCDGYVPGLSGYLIFTATSSKALAPIIRRLGSNTAGVGVCFLDRNGWRTEMRRAGFRVLDFDPERYENDLSRHKKALLLIRDLRCAHFWLAVDGSRPAGD